MKRGGHLLAAALTLLSVVMPVRAEATTPHPRSTEWWFSVWGIESDVWPVTKGAGVTVAVLDTGVNAALPELSGVVLKGEDSTGGKTDGRRDLDDREGGHGTAMAAMIAGQGGGTTDFVGIAPEAKILPIHDAGRLGDKNGLFESYAEGIHFATDHGAKVINFSQGVTSATMDGHCEPGIQSAIAYAVDHDVVVVASAGNTGNTTNWPELPGSCAGVLTVGAIDPALRPWKGTQRQPYVAVAAPGDRIPSIGKKGELYRDGRGTSASAALTSGAVALIRSSNPHMPARTVVQRLIATARPSGGSRWNDQTGYGAIQITSAMNPKRYPVSADAPNPVYAALDKWRAAQRGSVVRPQPSPQAQKRDTSGSSFPLALGGAVLIALTALVVVYRRRSRRSPPAMADEPMNEYRGGH
ncbi:type VII secretion-associated serine protease mycosin [Actinoallomurus bryophytorum]|uniref:Type VII secretion-associated serine protease mycosin n=1 Tax=Actinoallomurus bryophytorum TaxID=1490222 RepID=A0A543CFM2_9ACTN|nr:S8 family serine peptidase [Actinoallomurus bryophytorum]TQL95902.1 type VII secretion-associated serine protease mycosin [Actinoallomurus bryophytorum]